MVAYADLVLPDTTYLERHDCISLLDRPICEPDAVADAIRWPVVELKRNVRGFQSVLLDLGARLGLPGMVDESGAPMYRDYADYMINHQRQRGVGPLAGFRGTGNDSGRGEPNAKQLDAYIENGGFWIQELPDALATTKRRTRTISGLRLRWDFMMRPRLMFTRFIVKNYRNSGWQLKASDQNNHQNTS